MFIDYQAIAIYGGIVLAALILILMMIRVIVPPEYADVIIQGKKRKVYCSDKKINNSGKSIYYKIPAFVPIAGMYVKRIPLNVIEIQVHDYETFAQRNARFICDVSVYGKVNNPEIAAQRWPGRTLGEFREGIKELIVAAIRNTTTKFPVEDVIAKKQEIARGIQESLEEDMQVYGFDVTNVAVVGISDPEDGRTTVIRDISAKMEAEINSESRKQIAIKKKDAEIIEAESLEKSQIRQQQAQQKIGEAEQEKNRAIYVTQQLAQEEAMKVVKVKQVRQAEINRESKIIEAEGDQMSVIKRKEGEAEGIKKVGLAEAEITKAKGLAEATAKEKMAEALNKFNEAAKFIREIEKDEKIGIAGMDALGKSQIKLVSTDKIESFIDLFSAKGGARIGGMMESFRQTNPKLADELGNILQLLGNSTKKDNDDKGGKKEKDTSSKNN